MALTNLRPGVYSRYEVSSFYTPAASRRDAALVARCGAGDPGQAYRVTSETAAAALFSGETALLEAVRLLLRSGVGAVQVAPVRDGDYQAALAVTAALDNIGLVLCDCEAVAEMELLRDSVQQASDALRERIGIVGISDPQVALETAQTLNHERMVLVTPGAAPAGRDAAALGLYAAAAVAGAVLAQDDAAHNYNGQALTLLDLPQRLPEEQVQALLAGGVTVVEPVGDSPRMVRALTTSTRISDVPDRTMSGLNTVLIIDTVMQGVRQALSARLGGGRISDRSLDAVLTQTTVELARQQENGLLQSFAAPRVYGSSEDPAVCVVELSFQVAHVLSQIHVVAHVQV